ncbi:MAG: hypothetical protein AAFQ94_06605 [Bacteroidota bacterium]
MKRLFYLLIVLVFVATVSSCSTGESLEEITVKTPESELSADQKNSKQVNSKHQPGRETVKPKSPF